ncbi:MAG: tyrosine-type recombinase/integrase [Rhodococcus sp. (in: high G+C Gram-positive bacteria)]
MTTRSILALAARQDWSNDHRRGLRASLGQFFDWAIDTGLVESNPADGLPTVSESKPRPRPVGDRMWMQLLTDADPRERLAARLAEEAGCRREEAAKVHTEDVVDGIDGYELVIHGKGAKQRMVPITDALARDILKGANGHTPGLATSGYLFPGAVDGHISADWIGKIVGRLLPHGWTMHKLRHRYATTLYYATQDYMICKELLGHESMATTQRYIAVTRAQLRDAVNKRAAAAPIAA